LGWVLITQRHIAPGFREWLLVNFMQWWLKGVKVAPGDKESQKITFIVRSSENTKKNIKSISYISTEEEKWVFYT
jgi:hypothetical protein